jgi:site-specific recombinase XerC
MESAAEHHCNLSIEIIKIRNNAIRALMTEHGIELHQIMSITLKDIDLSQKRLGVEQDSASNPRYIILSHGTVTALAHYLWVRSPSEEKKLFLSEHISDRSKSLSSAIGWQSFN